MLRNALGTFINVQRCSVTKQLVKPGFTAAVRCSSGEANPGLAMPKHGRGETDEQFDTRYEAYFNRKDIDGWEIRKGINDLQGMDLVPEPKIIIAALKACRRVNDYALCIRLLEAVKFKCGSSVAEIYPYLIQEIRPTLDELGISTPEELGYDKPELAMANPYDIHG
ncbi:Cytochrome c oxidase subunit 5A, mitochondrial [Halotydeus destructor]|nr:Cytochrome c oxidase subunit 5A, mitochondrial [Halotydeus destructor]